MLTLHRILGVARYSERVAIAWRNASHLSCSDFRPSQDHKMPSSIDDVSIEADAVALHLPAARRSVLG